MLGEAVQFAVVFLDLFLAEEVDDFGSWVHALVNEFTFDILGVWFEFGSGK